MACLKSPEDINTFFWLRKDTHLGLDCGGRYTHRHCQRAILSLHYTTILMCLPLFSCLPFEGRPLVHGLHRQESHKLNNVTGRSLRNIVAYVIYKAWKQRENLSYNCGYLSLTFLPLGDSRMCYYSPTVTVCYVW